MNTNGAIKVSRDSGTISHWTSGPQTAVWQ